MWEGGSRKRRMDDMERHPEHTKNKLRRREEVILPIVRSSPQVNHAGRYEQYYRRRRQYLANFLSRQVPRHPRLMRPVTYESRALPTDYDIHGSMDIDLAEERQKRKLKRILQKQTKTCRTCLHTHEIKFINLPCGHMTNCSNCAPLMMRCTVCYATISRAVSFDFQGRFWFLDWFC